MPGGDRTGPTGSGPMTGRAMGFCRGGNLPGFASWCGRRPRRGGRGLGHFVDFAPSVADSQAEIDLLRRQLEQIKARIEQLEK